MKIILISCFVVLSCFAWGDTNFSRKEYLIPLRVDSDTVIPMNATFSCNTSECDKKFTNINISDPAPIYLAKNVHEFIRSGDVDALKKLAFPKPHVDKKIEEDLEVLERFQIGGYQNYSNKDIAVRAVVNVGDARYVYCLAKNEQNKATSFVYAFRKGSNGQWLWDPLDEFYFGDIQAALFAKFSGKGRFSSPLKEPLLQKKLLTNNALDDNFVSLNYHMVSLAKGVPVANEKYVDTIKELQSYWQSVLTKTVDNLSENFDEKSYRSLKKEDSKVGYVGSSGLLRKTVTDEFRLTHIIYADPVIFVSYELRDLFTTAVFIEEKGEVKRIRYHNYGGARDLFEGILSESSARSITRWIH